MAADEKIQEAIEQAVKEAGQGQGLSRKLIRWFEAIASGNEGINDTQSAFLHLELLYDETQIDSETGDSPLKELASTLDDEEELP